MIRNSGVVSILSVTLYLLLIITVPGNAMVAGDIKTGCLSAEPIEKPVQVAAEPDSLSLQDCIRIAMQNSPIIHFRESKLAEAGAERDRAEGRRWPDIKSSGSYSRYTETLRMAPPREPGYPLIFADEILWWNVHASIPIFTGWRISNEVDAYEFSMDAARNTLEFSRGRIEYEVTELYYSILKQRMVIQSLDFSRRALREHLDKVNELIAAEKASRSDMLRVEVRLADVAQRIEENKGELAVDKRSLLNLMGIEQDVIAIKYPEELSTSYTVPAIQDALTSAYSRRADYLAAKKELEAQRKRVKAARSEYWPTVSLFASYSGQKAVGSYIELPGASELEDIGKVGCMLEIPIFTGGSRGAKLNIQKSKLAGMENSLRELKLKIRLEVESAIYRLESARKRMTATEKAVVQALESLRIEREKYKLGKGAVTDVLDAEAALQKMRAARYSALAEYHIQIARIKFKTGEYHEFHQ